MSVLIRLSPGERGQFLEPQFVKEIIREIRRAGGEAFFQAPPQADDLGNTKWDGSWKSAADIVLAVGSAGAFTVIYNIIAKYLERYKDRELQLERDGTKLIIRGHSMSEAQEILKLVWPSPPPKHADNIEKNANDTPSV